MYAMVSVTINLIMNTTPLHTMLLSLRVCSLSLTLEQSAEEHCCITVTQPDFKDEPWSVLALTSFSDVDGGCSGFMGSDDGAVRRRLQLTALRTIASVKALCCRGRIVCSLFSFMYFLLFLCVITCIRPNPCYATHRTPADSCQDCRPYRAILSESAVLVFFISFGVTKKLSDYFEKVSSGSCICKQPFADTTNAIFSPAKSVSTFKFILNQIILTLNNNIY
uniref:Uncharacterized protein n=1 Tax=Setaria italica TaxID=4555 RepID=K3YVK3_SETIT